MYTIQNLIDRTTRGETLKYIFFWGHQPSKDNEVTNSCFSQWWEAPFDVNGVIYKSAEHWMMAKKAELFNDNDTRDRIISSKTPAEAKKLGRKVANFDQQKWEDARFGIVVEGNYHKFSQHPALKLYLINTRDRILVEASPVDDIWGIGLAKDNDLVKSPETWKGLNLLGFALMEVRDKLS